MSTAEWSIILAARNGEDTLPATLAALAKVERPKGGLQIILVDNASTDGTGRILRKFAEAHSALFLEEPRCGKSFALNTAIERATGEILVFIDDDAIASPGWLRAYEAALDRFPSASVFAGQVRPHWLATPPEWLETLASAGRACACTDIGAPAGLYPARHVKGPNFAVRRSDLGKHRFDTGEANYGAGGTRKIGGEDTLLALTLQMDGKEIVYVPEAVASHIINAKEMSLRGVFRHFMRVGRGIAARSGRSPFSLVESGAKIVPLGMVALVMLGLRRRNDAALWMTKMAMSIGRLDYNLRSPW